MRVLRISAVLATSLLAVACEAWHVLPERVPAGDAELHTWMYYPQTDAYLCLDHGHGYVRADGAWRRASWLGLADRTGSSHEIEESDDLPYRHNGFHRVLYVGHPGIETPRHEWVLYPRCQVYVCEIHSHAFEFDGRTWRKTIRARPAPAGEPFLWLGDVGPVPYPQYGVHLRLWEERREPLVPPGWQERRP